MLKQLNLWANVRNLLLRYFMICVFMFMCMVIISFNSGILGPVFGVFYFVALIYYFWFTMKVEGEKDVNRVATGQMPYFRWKGALCALIVAVPLILLHFIPDFFVDPTPAEYKAYFTGEPVQIAETDRFNADLKKASGENGYISEVLFQPNGRLDQVVYVTTNGYYIKCDGTVQDTTKMYAASKERLTLTSKAEEVTYFTDNAQLSEEETAAFTQCRNSLNDIAEVMGKVPAWQNVFGIIKVIISVGLQYFYGIFVDAKTHLILASVIYSACMLVLCVAAQVGYEMGYRNISILRKKKPVPTGAGDSVTVQHGSQSE